MRIITGSKRGKKLIALEGDDVRPTTDRVKESLFNILQFRIEGRRFLDLFAGSGQVGLEALSRGAKAAAFVDTSKRAVSVIRKNIEATGFEKEAQVYFGDFSTYLQRTADVFDVAFLDPPYQKGLLLPALEAVVRVMAPSGVVICEHPNGEALPETVGAFRKMKSYRYGKIILTSYERPQE